MNVDSHFEENSIHGPTENERHSKNSIFVLKNIIYLFIRARIFLKRFLGARLIYLLNILNTSHIERLLNTYYAASAGDPLERNKQVIANTLESHTRVISGIHWRNKRGSRHLKGRGVRYDFIENVALELSLRSCL